MLGERSTSRETSHDIPLSPTLKALQFLLFSGETWRRSFHLQQWPVFGCPGLCQQGTHGTQVTQGGVVLGACLCQAQKGGKKNLQNESSKEVHDEVQEELHLPCLPSLLWRAVKQSHMGSDHGLQATGRIGAHFYGQRCFWVGACIHVCGAWCACKCLSRLTISPPLHFGGQAKSFLIPKLVAQCTEARFCLGAQRLHQPPPLQSYLFLSGLPCA